MAAQYQPVGTVFNDAAPAAQAGLAGLAGCDGMILREIARQHFAARESVIVAERHLKHILRANVTGDTNRFTARSQTVIRRQT